MDQAYIFNEHNRLSKAMGIPVGYLQTDNSKYFSFYELQKNIVQQIKNGTLSQQEYTNNEFREEFLKFFNTKDDIIIFHTIGFLIKVIHSKASIDLLAECQLISPQLINQMSIDSAHKEKLLSVNVDAYIIQSLIKLTRIEENASRGITCYSINTLIDLLCFNPKTQSLSINQTLCGLIVEAYKTSVNNFNHSLKLEKRENGYFELFKKEWDRAINWKLNSIYSCIADPILLLINLDDPEIAKYSPDIAFSNDIITSMQTILQRAYLFMLMKHGTRTLGPFPLQLSSCGEYKDGDVVPYQKVKKVTSCIEIVNKTPTERYIIEDEMRFIYIERQQNAQQVPLMKILKCCLLRYIECTNSTEQFKIKDLIINFRVPGEAQTPLTLTFDNFSKRDIIKESIESKKKLMSEQELLKIIAFLQKLD